MTGPNIWPESLKDCQILGDCFTKSDERVILWQSGDTYNISIFTPEEERTLVFTKSEIAFLEGIIYVALHPEETFF